MTSWEKVQVVEGGEMKQEKSDTKKTEEKETEWTSPSTDGAQEGVHVRELKLELVAEMDYASLELQVEAIIDKVYALTESPE